MINGRASLETHYDFIVVDAGAAGSVLAAELSASGAEVLVIESGGPDDPPTIARRSGNLPDLLRRVLDAQLAHAKWAWISSPLSTQIFEYTALQVYVWPTRR